MIRLASGAMVYIPNGEKENSKNKPFGIVIDEGIWIAQERVTFELANLFYESLPNQTKFEIRNKKGLGTFTSRKAVYMFCNWLSAAANYEPVYIIGDSADQGIDSISVEKSNGFRIPTMEERVYIATCAEQSEILGNLYSKEKMFKSVRTQPMNFQTEHRDDFLSTPSPWGFKNIFSFPAELNSDVRGSGELVNSTPTDVPFKNLAFISTTESSVGANCLRLVRGPIEETKIPSAK